MTLTGSALSVACPNCGSREIFYSCEPQCCFNHVCAGCRTSFQLRTVEAPGAARPVARPNPLPPCDAPLAACAACGRPAVYATAEGPGCAECGARLTLSLEEVDPPAG